MDRGIRVAPPSGVGARSLGRGAALALTLFALAALPLAAAETGPSPLQARVSDIQVLPNPALPGPITVSATVLSESASQLARYVRFLVDSPFNGTLHYMFAVDGSFDVTDERVTWSGLYGDFGPGWHTLYVHASVDRVVWGPFEAFTFRADTPDLRGPDVTAVATIPVDVARGEPLTVRASLVDPFAQPPWDSSVAAVELFVDTFTGDGNGTAFPGPFGGGTADVAWSGNLTLPGGAHVVKVHGRNAYGTWGPLAEAPFTVRTPSFTLTLAVDRGTALRDEPVVYTVSFANVGNANATLVWVDLALPPAVSYVADNVSEVGGNRTGPTSYVFADVAPGARSFHVDTRVVADAADGSALDATATLDYTNAKGWNYGSVTDSVSGSVVAPEIEVAFSASGPGYAGETVTSSITLIHSGFRAIPSLDVTLDPDRSPWMDPVPVADTAGSLGGVSIGPRAWRFTAIANGFHTFTVTERIRPDAPDGAQIYRTLDVAYASRFGDSVRVPASYSIPLARPSFTLRAAAEPQEVTVGNRFSVTVDFANVGSATARDVQVRLTLPPQFALVGGDAPSAASGTQASWVRRDVVPSPYALHIELEAREPGAVELAFTLLYSTPNGEPLGIVEASLVAVAQPRPPPIAETYAGFGVVGALIAFAGFLATERGKTAALFLFVPLYTRLRHEKVLDHETRGMIRGYIVANPGDHYNSIKEALELPNGTLAYHIQVLEKESLVRSVKDGKFRRFYPYDMRVPESGEPTRIQKHILDLVRANPGLTPRDAAGLLGLTSSTVSYHLERLLELDRVEVRREGISKRLYVKGDLET